MQINHIQINGIFAGAFNLHGKRVIISSHYHTANAMTNFAASMIDCGTKADIERKMAADETSGSSPAFAAMMFAIGRKVLIQQSAVTAAARLSCIRIKNY